MQEISLVNFEKEVVKSKLPTLLCFWASWSNASIEMIKIMQELEPEFNGKFKFLKSNIFTNKDLADKLGVRGVPYITLFEKEELIESINGLRTVPELRKKMDLYLAR